MAPTGFGSYLNWGPLCSPGCSRLFYSQQIWEILKSEASLQQGFSGSLPSMERPDAS